MSFAFISVERYVQGTIMDMEHLKRAMSGCGSVLHLASLKKFLGVSDALCRSINVDGTKNVSVALPLHFQSTLPTSTFLPGITLPISHTPDFLLWLLPR